MLKLYSHPVSSYSRRVRMALLEKKIDVELIEVDLLGGAQRKEPYTALHPYARVPTLVDGDFVLPESTPILEYLELLHPEPALVPRDARGRAEVALHMKLCDIEFTPHAGVFIFQKRFLPKERWRPEEMAKAKPRIEKALEILERYLANKQYLVADTFSLADICYAPQLYFLGLTEVEPGPNVRAWIHWLLARESAQATKPPM